MFVEQVPGSRRLSQRISEGDGIAIIVCVHDAAGAREAEEQGAKAIAVHGPIDGIRDATTLPLLWIGGEIFLLCAREIDEDADPLDAVLELLPDVPAGKLAIAEVDVGSRDEVLALERAGIDAVLVPNKHVGDLVGHRPFDV